MKAVSASTLAYPLIILCSSVKYGFILELLVVTIYGKLKLVALAEFSSFSRVGFTPIFTSLILSRWLLARHKLGGFCELNVILALVIFRSCAILSCLFCTVILFKLVLYECGTEIFGTD